MLDPFTYDKDCTAVSGLNSSVVVRGTVHALLHCIFLLFFMGDTAAISL